MTTEKNQPVLTPVALARFINVFEPRVVTGPDANPNALPKYEVNLVFPEGADLTELKQAAFKAGQIKFGMDKAKWPKFAHPLFKKAEDLKEKHYGAYKGRIVLRASTTDPVGVVDADVQPIINPRDVYAGCEVIAQVKFAGYQRLGNSGISCYLMNIQKVSDGEALSGGPRAEDAFSPVGGGKSAVEDDDIPMDL